MIYLSTLQAKDSNFREAQHCWVCKNSAFMIRSDLWGRSGEKGREEQREVGRDWTLAVWAPGLPVCASSMRYLEQFLKFQPRTLGWIRQSGCFYLFPMDLIRIVSEPKLPFLSAQKHCSLDYLCGSSGDPSAGLLDMEAVRLTILRSAC